MKLTPSQFTIDHLKTSAIEIPADGFSVPDGAYEDAVTLLKPSHSTESDEDFKDRIDLYMIAQFYGNVQSGGQSGAERTNAARVSAMTREIVEMKDVHLPNLKAVVSQAMENSSGVIRGALDSGHAKVVAALGELKTFEGESHAEMLRVKTEFYDSISALAQRAWKFTAGALGAVIVLLILIALFSSHAFGQGTPVIANQSNGAKLHVTCDAGCSSSSSPTIGNAMPSTATPVGGTDGANFQALHLDGSFNLKINCAVGCAGGSSTPSNAFANPTTAGLSMSFNTMWNGTSWDLVKGDTTNGLWVNCKTGCAGGSSTPSDAFANPTTAGLSQGFTMMWNGASWDRVKGDTTSGLWVNLKNASVAVTAAALPLPSNAAQETGGNLAAIKTDADKIPAQGQALAAASMPVVLPAAQITTLTPPAAITNFANETGGNLAAIKADVDKIPAQGQALAAASMPVVLTAAQLATLTPLATVATTPPANASTNIAQYNGTTVGTANPVIVREGDATNVVTLDPCRVQVNIFARISQTANTQIITGTAAKKIYICALNLVTAGANNVAIVEGTGTVCATGIAGVSTGGTTAATGWNLAANGGLAYGSGIASIMGTGTNADNVCILQSAAVQLSGVISYVVQ